MSTSTDDPRLQQTGAVPQTQEQPAPTPEPATPGTAPTSPPPAAPLTPGIGEERIITKDDILRPSIGALMTALGCAFMVGGMFVGITPRLYAAIGALAGVGLAVWAARAAIEGGRRANVIQILSLLGVLVVGLILLAITDFGAVTNIGKTVGKAASNVRLKRPPAPFELGWRAILPWTLGMIAYASAYMGSIGRRPALGVLLPIPFTAFAAIAQPAEAQIAAGIVSFATFAIGLAIIYRADRGEGEGVSMSYELKRAAKTAPLLIVLIVALGAASQAGFLFPDPVYDPTQIAQEPQATPLSQVQDRVLFTTRAESFTGPWRVGVLDVYKGGKWLIPPYAAGKLTPAPTSGLLYEEFGNPGVRQQTAHIEVETLDGTVLPLPSRIYGLVVPSGPKLVLNRRDQTVRVEVGQLEGGLTYDVAFALLPKPDLLKTAPKPNAELAPFLTTDNQPPPPAVQALLEQADRRKLTSAWERVDFLRKTLLETVTAAGQGLPVPVPPERVQDMLDGSKEATPYEIVAAQALVARWAGVPSRIGYGFDRGETKTDGSKVREFHPKHGSAWLEVYFQGHGWFPVTGLPKTTKASFQPSDQTINADILPSDEIQVQLWIPLRTQPEALLFKQIQKILLLVLPFVAVGTFVWVMWPAVYKARRRSRRRQWALEYGRAARIAVAYTELRDMATDLGVGDPYATPLAYTRKVVPDEEHKELAWLVTRCLWGDLRTQITDDEVFAADELSRSLRRRLFEAQPFTIRFISVVSRLSLRDPYAPELLSPPVEKVAVGALLKRIVMSPVSLIRGVFTRRKKEIPDEAVETA